MLGQPKVSHLGGGGHGGGQFRVVVELCLQHVGWGASGELQERTGTGTHTHTQRLNPTLITMFSPSPPHTPHTLYDRQTLSHTHTHTLTYSTLVASFFPSLIYAHTDPPTLMTMLSPSPSTSRLSGLRSKWMTAGSWSCRYDMPSAACTATWHRSRRLSFTPVRSFCRGAGGGVAQHGGRVSRAGGQQAQLHVREQLLKGAGIGTRGAA